MSDAWVLFRPLDAVVFRDGRPFSAGLTASARTVFPRPTSTSGAITAAFDGVEPREVTGPLVVDTRTPPQLRFLSPANLVLDGAWGKALAPSDDPKGSLVTDLDDGGGIGADHRLLEGAGESVSTLLTHDEMESYLALEVDDIVESLGTRTAHHGVPSGFGSVIATETRIGLARDGRRVREGFLYSAEFLRFRDETSGFACRVFFDGDVPPARPIVRLGGEARQAEVTVVAADPGSWLPRRPRSFPGGRLLLYLATPAIFTEGWVPDQAARESDRDAAGFRVCSACVAGPDAVASWSVGRPRANPLRWAVPAGSVYFLLFASEGAAEGFAAEWHGRCLPQADERLRTAGFGMCLTGRW